MPAFFFIGYVNLPHNYIGMDIRHYVASYGIDDMAFLQVNLVAQ